MDAVKKYAMTFEFTPEQVGAIHESPMRDGKLLAVRSSSPEEDLEGASFAGGYETVLGVTKDTLEKAIETAFVSCLDERIYVYKRENGFVIY